MKIQLRLIGIIFSFLLIGCSEYSDDPTLYESLVGTYDLVAMKIENTTEFIFFPLTSTSEFPNAEGTMEIFPNGDMLQQFKKQPSGIWVTIFGTFKINDDSDRFKIDDEISGMTYYYYIRYEGEFLKTIKYGQSFPIYSKPEDSSKETIYTWLKQD